MTVERPRQKGHGDYATNVALQLAKKAGHEPARLRRAGAASGSSAADGIAGGRRSPARASSTSPSRPAPRARSRPQIVAAGASYGASDAFAGEKINLEFVSANPTGPLHIGGVRWAAVGDALGRIFDDDRRRGHPGVLLQRPRRPDRPVQPLAAGQRARASRRPEDGYGGDYIDEIADGGRGQARPRSWTCPTTRRRRSSAPTGVEMMFDEIKKSLHDFGVDFDVYFHENNLHKSGAVDRAIDAAHRARQHLREGRRPLAAPPRSSATTRTG